MKKLIFAVLLGLFCFSHVVYAAEGNQFRIVISAVPPAEVLLYLQDYGDFVPIDAFGIPGKTQGVFDYGVAMYSKKSSPSPEIVDAYALLSLTPMVGEGGKIIPGQYVTDLAGLIFMDEKFAWFVSEEAKDVFIKATR